MSPAPVPEPLHKIASRRARGSATLLGLLVGAAARMSLEAQDLVDDLTKEQKREGNVEVVTIGDLQIGDRFRQDGKFWTVEDWEWCEGSRGRKKHINGSHCYHVTTRVLRQLTPAQMQARIDAKLQKLGLEKAYARSA